jgi:hypothetical protein
MARRITCPDTTGLPSSEKPTAPASARSAISVSSQPASPRVIAATGSTRMTPSLGLVREGEITLPFLIERLTLRPAEILNLPYGRLTPGSAADVTLFDPEQEWDVDPQRFLSKGKNTPLAGATLRGKVQLTLFGGQPAYVGERLQGVLNLNMGWGGK